MVPDCPVQDGPNLDEQSGDCHLAADFLVEDLVVVDVEEVAVHICVEELDEGLKELVLRWARTLEVSSLMLVEAKPKLVIG